MNGQGGITGLAVTGTGTDANVDYTSPNIHNILPGAGAVFDINRTGAVYTATFSNNGNRFAQNETIDIAGTELGDSSPQMIVKLLLTQ